MSIGTDRDPQKPEDCRLAPRVRVSALVAILGAFALCASPGQAQVAPSADRASSSAVAGASQQPGPHHSFAVWRGGDSSIPEQTILRPADLTKVSFKMPIVVWGNGGCRRSNEEFRYFLTTFASYGTFIVANGVPENPYEPTELTGLVDPRPELLIQGIDWALRQNADRRSPYFHRLDPKRILVMGQSCGGMEAVDASSDPRVTATIVWNSGANPYHPQGAFELHAPVLLAHGGPIDHVAAMTVATYQVVTVPAVLVSHNDGGHTNWWDDPPEGEPRPSAEQRVPGPLAAKWMAFTLYNSASGREYFLGPDCGLCNEPGWAVESKNWQKADQQKSRLERLTQ